MRLTDVTVAAQPRDKTYKLSDGASLIVLVNPNGSKWWRLRYRIRERENIFASEPTRR
jgi:hypothetical protein